MLLIFSASLRLLLLPLLRAVGPTRTRLVLWFCRNVLPAAWRAACVFAFALAQTKVPADDVDRRAFRADKVSGLAIVRHEHHQLVLCHSAFRVLPTVAAAFVCWPWREDVKVRAFDELVVEAETLAGVHKVPHSAVLGCRRAHGSCRACCCDVEPAGCCDVPAQHAAQHGQQLLSLKLAHRRVGVAFVLVPSHRHGQHRTRAEPQQCVVHSRHRRPCFLAHKQSARQATERLSGKKAATRKQGTAKKDGQQGRRGACACGRRV